MCRRCCAGPAGPALAAASQPPGPRHRRGRLGGGRDDAEARAAVEAGRRRRIAEHAKAVAEVLGSAPGARLSEPAARAALAALMAAVRRGPTTGSRGVVTEGLACTVFRVASAEGRPVIVGPRWVVWLPGQVVVFHQPGTDTARPGFFAPQGDGPIVLRVRPAEGAA